MRALSRSRPGWIPSGLGEALGAILAELARLRDEPVPDDELAKAKRYLSGGLELRMDDTRHVASWVGGQEALHDRVLTLEEALEAVEAVDAAAVQRVAERPRARRRPPARGRRPGPLPARSRCAPAGAGMTEPDAANDAAIATVDAPSRGADLVLAGLHLRMGSLSLARAELETLAGAGALDALGAVDLAEARWRTGDLVGAGEVAREVLAGGLEAVVVLVIAAEAAAGLGRPSEARRIAGRALTLADGPIDPVFAGMPRSAVWPADPAEPVPSPATLFPPDRAAHPGDGDAPVTDAAAEDDVLHLHPGPLPDDPGLWDQTEPDLAPVRPAWHAPAAHRRERAARHRSARDRVRRPRDGGGRPRPRGPAGSGAGPGRPGRHR